MSVSYVNYEDYLKQIEKMPTGVIENLKKIQKMDEKVSEQKKLLKKKEEKFLVKLKGAKQKKLFLKEKENQQQLQKIQRLQNDCIEIQKKKIKIANNIYENIDEEIQKLDQNLKAFEKDIKQNSFEINKLTSRQNIQQQLLRRSKNIRLGSRYRSHQKQNQKQVPNLVALTKEKLNSINEQENPIDPNEQHYCYCNGISYGQMLACDNPFCEKEWFHFDCIGIKKQPKGEWYCKDCQKKKKGEITLSSLVNLKKKIQK